tara:strand:- start:3749 stop:5455 length:1707 start_codon:yes stop_codon:yes gene_type:complete
MMEVDIEKKSKEIQRIISRYTKTSFVCFFADFIRHHPERSNTGFSNEFKSKLKDSLYLIMLRLSSKEEGIEELFYSHENDQVLRQVAKILLEITNFYLSNKNLESLVEIEDERRKRLVHELVFKDYFQNGVINYIEQEYNKVIRLFKPYQNIIKERLGIQLDTLLDMCYYSEKLYREKSAKSKSFILDNDLKSLMTRLAQGQIENESFQEELSKLPKKTYEAFSNFFDKPHDCLLFFKEDYYSVFNKSDVDIFCELFSININDSFDITFYSQSNPLEDSPIIKINENEYLNVYQKQLPTALYRLLYKTLTQTSKEREQLNRRKGKVVLENQTLEVFETFFKKVKNLIFFTNYYVDDFIEEKDILIIANKKAYIIECKSSRNREPKRDIKMAYQRIKSDFRECIQKGYDQCYHVEQKMLNDEKIIVRTKNGIHEIITSSIDDIFTIVITSERFASIQSDLGLLLKRHDIEDLYPWSVCIDDLEIFLKTLNIKFNNPVRRFSEFLEYRELLNERLITRDELDVCAMYLKNDRNFKENCEAEFVILTDPTLQSYFDQLYFEKKLRFKLLDL